MTEPELASHSWWNFATAVNYLRDGTIPDDPVKIDWFSLPAAREKTKKLNTAMQTGKIDVIVVMIDGSRRAFERNGSRNTLPIEELATLAVHFRYRSFLGGGVGVVSEVSDIRTGERLRDVKELLLKAEDVWSLRVTEVPSVEVPPVEVVDIRSNKDWFNWAIKNVPPDDRRHGWKKRYAQKLENRMKTDADAPSNSNIEPLPWTSIRARLNEIGWPEIDDERTTI